MGQISMEKSGLTGSVLSGNQHWDHPWMTTGLTMAGVWMMIGNFIMHRMIRFKI